MAKSDLNELRPQLKECDLFEGERNIVVEDSRTKTQIVLPKENLHILKLLDGEHSIKDISSILYKDHGKVSFHSIITTIKLLSDANLLQEMDHDFEEVKEDKSPHEQKTSLLNRPLLELKLKNKITTNHHRDWIFFSFTALIISLMFINHEAFLDIKLKSFLKSSTDYGEALLRLFFISSCLMSMKAILQGALLLSSTGTFYGPYLRFYPYAIALGINDNSIYSHPRKGVIITYGFLSAFLYLVSFSGLALVPNLNTYYSDIGIIAILLTLIELNPYRRSDLTKLFYFFYAESQLKNIKPYLENCSLVGIFKKSDEKLFDELRYVTYSVLAILWAIGFSLFSFEIVLINLPSLLLESQLGSSLSKYSAIAVGSGLIFITGYLMLDLFHTVVKNIISPILVPFKKLKSKGESYREKVLSIEDVYHDLRRHMLFNQFSEDALDFLLENSTLKTMKPGSHLILQGDNSRNVFFLISGQVEVNVRENTGRIKHIVSLGPKTILGEMAILAKTKRSANVVASSEIVYLEMPETAFTELMENIKYENDFQRLKSLIEISQFVSSAPLFKDFPVEVMKLFVEAGDLVLFPSGHNVVEEGESDKTFFLLLKGKVEVQKQGLKIAELGQGSFFGEVALIANVPRTATVKTVEDCLFLYIENKNFWKILSQNIELAMYIESVGRHRMDEAA